MAAATPNSGADLAPAAASAAVALVPSGTLLVADVHTLLRAVYGLDAEAVGVATTGVFGTPSVIDGWLTPAPRVARRDGRVRLVHDAALRRPSHTREYGQQPTTKESRAGQLERPTPGDGARSKPLCYLVEAIDDSLLSEAEIRPERRCVEA